MLSHLARGRRTQAANHGAINLRVVDFRTDMDLVALDQRLNSLASVDESKSKIVQQRFVGRLSAEETAEVLRVDAHAHARLEFYQGLAIAGTAGGVVR